MFFSDPVIFEIPVLPRIKKFISAKLRDEKGNPQPMLASPQALGAGMYLWSLAQSEKVMLNLGWLRKENRRVQPAPDQLLADNSGRVLAPDDMTERLGLGICEFHKSRRQYLFNYPELVVFSNYVDYIILNELYCFCEDAPQIAPMARIKAFCDQYDFSPEDFDERALKMVIWRAETRKAGLNFNRNLLQLNHFTPYTAEMAMAA